MSDNKINSVVLVGIYNIMGEGLVAELDDGNQGALYDKRGLQYRIIERKKAGIDTQVEERALRQINSVTSLADFTEFSGSP